MIDQKRVVLDANSLLRAVFGVRVRGLRFIVQVFILRNFDALRKPLDPLLESGIERLSLFGAVVHILAKKKRETNREWGRTQARVSSPAKQSSTDAEAQSAGP